MHLFRKMSKCFDLSRLKADLSLVSVSGDTSTSWIDTSEARSESDADMRDQK